jgi:ABC-type uncharacterized transport system ATPase component
LLKVLSGRLKLSEGFLEPHAAYEAAYMDQFAGDMLSNDLTIAEQFKAADMGNVAHGIAPTAMLAEFGIGLQNRLDAFIGHLSGGERQIVALLCTLAAGAKVLCLDEFTSALDVRSGQIADTLLNHANTAACIALVLVSHSGVGIRGARELNMSQYEE